MEMESKPGARARLSGSGSKRPVSGLTLAGYCCGPEANGAGVGVSVAVGEGLAVRLAVAEGGMGDALAVELKPGGVTGVAVGTAAGAQPIRANNVKNIKELNARDMTVL